MNKSKGIMFFCGLLLILIVLMWISGVIPRYIAKATAIKYVEENYSHLNLEFNKIDYSKSHGSYFAVFKDLGGSIYSFQLETKYFPTLIWFDPIAEEAK